MNANRERIRRKAQRDRRAEHIIVETIVVPLDKRKFGRSLHLASSRPHSPKVSSCRQVRRIKNRKLTRRQKNKFAEKCRALTAAEDSGEKDEVEETRR